MKKLFKKLLYGFIILIILSLVILLIDTYIKNKMITDVFKGLLGLMFIICILIVITVILVKYLKKKNIIKKDRISILKIYSIVSQILLMLMFITMFIYHIFINKDSEVVTGAMIIIIIITPTLIYLFKSKLK